MQNSLNDTEERLRKCAEAIQQALTEYHCQMYTALKVGNAESPLLEVGGFPVVVKIANDSQA